MSRGEIALRVPDPLALALKEMSDLGNAERLIERYEGRLLHVDGAGWSAYDGTRWSAEHGAQLAARAAHDVARSMRDEIRALAEAPESAWPTGWTKEMIGERLLNLRKWAVNSGNANKTAAMLAQASNLLSASRDDFDTDPLAINVSSGTLHLVKDKDGAWSVEETPHDPADMISRVMAVHYDPEARCPEWDAHMATVLPDPAVRRYFQQCIGYAMTGLITEQCVFLLQGRGGDGKSTTMNVLREIWGGYGAATDVKSFMAGAIQSGADASPDMARLAGDMRLASTGEPRRGGQLDEAKIKSITGGSPIAARELHGKIFEYVPRFKLFLECNSRPRISGDDDGIWRRIIVIMFPHQFKGGAADKRIHDRLIAEAPGILNWAIDGMIEWLEAGQLAQPEAVIAAVEDYRRAANPFGEWMAERVDTSDPLALVLSKDLYADYKQWCDDNGVADREVMTSTAFGRALGDRQILKGPKDREGLVRRRGARLRVPGVYAPEPSASAVSTPPAGHPAALDDDDFVPGYDQ